MSMLRHLDHYDEMNDVVLLHSARHDNAVIFGPELRELADRNDALRLHEQLTPDHGAYFVPYRRSPASPRTSA